MLRAAAKSFKDVVVITDIKDYENIKTEIVENKDICYKTRKKTCGEKFLT